MRSSRAVAGAGRAHSTGPGRSRSSRADEGCSSPPGASSSAPSRASSARSPSTPAAPIRSSTRARCSPSGAQSGAPRSAAPPARRSPPRSSASNSSARRSGPSRRGPSWPASAAAPPRATSSPRPKRRIAALVAEGRTNREVAAALFLTVHSVETALTRVYRKLGIRSRTELARHLRGKQLRFPAFAESRSVRECSATTGVGRNVEKALS